MKNDNSDEKRWKYKYLDTIEMLETKEHAWNLTEESLRRGLSRLALASAGLDADLDIQLKKLRKILSDKISRKSLDGIIEKISFCLKRLDDQRKTEAIESTPNTNTSAPLNLLCGLLETIEFPISSQANARRLQTALKRCDADQQLDHLVNEFSSLVASTFYQTNDTTTVTPTDDSKSSSQKGISGSAETLQAGMHDSSSQFEPGAQSLSDQHADLEKIGSSDTEPTDNAQLERAFLDFLERLSFPREFSERVHVLRMQLEAGLTADGVSSIVRRLVALVSENIQRLEQEKEELEIFLKQLGLRLRELDNMVKGAGNKHLASLASSRKLDEMVNAQVSDIEQTVRTVSDLGQMKGSIRGSLENIRQYLAENQQQEGVRATELEQQLKNLNQRLTLMEDESEHLRMRLSEERILSLIDPLTNVPNRLGYEKQVAQEFSRWQRYNNSLSLLVCDLDFFKRINDSYGHKAGDRALMAIAKSMTNQIRKTDYMARVGGEEFVVLLPETNLEVASKIAEKIRKAVESCAFMYDGNPVPVSISGGIAEFSEGDEIDDVYIRADRALYRAKRKGRNSFLLQE